MNKMMIKLTALVLVLPAAFLLPLTATADLKDGVVEAGSAVITSDGNITNVQLNSPNTIVSAPKANQAQGDVWNISGGSGYNFLLKVTGPDPTTLAGTTNAHNINFFLTNPNGIHVTDTATINANSFIASTLQISNNNFMAGNYAFMREQGRPYSSVINDGTIIGNNVALIGSSAANNGIIKAVAGTVHLASGDKTLVSFGQNGLIGVVVTEETTGSVIDANGNTVKDAVANSGTIEACQVYMTASTAKAMFKRAVNNTGMIKASKVVEERGVIKFYADNAAHNVDPVAISGTLQAKDADVVIDTPGVVELSGTISVEGGKVLIGQNIAPSMVMGTVPGPLSDGGGDCPHNAITADSISIIAGSITDINTRSQALSLYKTQGDTYISATMMDEPNNLVTIMGEGINVTYLKSADVTLKSDGLVDTAAGSIIQAKTLTITANKFGSASNTLNVNSENLTLIRTNGDINILDMIGIGDSIFMTGPPEDGILNISYNKEAKLTLNAQNISIVGDSVTHLYGDIVFSSLSCTIPGKTIIFESGHTYTILGTLTIEGAPGNNVSLESSIPGEGNEFKIYINAISNAHGKPYAEYISVSDSDAYGPITPIPCRHELIDKRNNTGWDPSRYWGGGSVAPDAGGDHLWSTATHWTGDTVPTSSDLAIFDATSTVICDIDVNADVLGIQIDASYIGTITQNATKTITVGASGWTQAGGTFTGNAAGITLNGAFGLSGGTFNAGSQTITANGDFNASGGTFGYGTSIINMAGSGTPTLTFGSQKAYSLTFSGSGTYNFADANVTFYGNWLQSGGTVNLPSGTLTNVTLDFFQSYTWTKTGGTLNPGSGKVYFAFSYGSTNTITGSQSFHDLKLGYHQNAHIVSGGSTVTVLGNLELENGSDAYCADLTGTIVVQGDITITSGSYFYPYSGAAEIRLTDGNDQALTGIQGVGRFFVPITIDKSGGTVTMSATTDGFNGLVTVDSGTLTLGAATNFAVGVAVSGGTLNLAGYTTAASVQFVIGANGTLKMTGDEASVTTPTSNTGTVEYSATSSTRDIKSWTYHNLDINGSGGTFTVSPANLTVSGNFILENGTFTAPAGILYVGGNWLQTGGTFTHNSGTVNFTKATGSQDILLGSSPFYNLTHSGAGTLYVWPYRKAITIDHTKVSTDLTDFPVLIYINADANIGANAQSDGDDLIFTDSNGDRLSHEIEYYNVSGGNATGYVWVKVPSLSSTTDTTIHLSYGNSNCASQQDAANVWDANYKGVWHLPNGTSLTANDSTSNSIDGTIGSAVTATSGSIDGAGNWDGSVNAYINIGNSIPTQLGQSMTLEGWIKTSGGGYQYLLAKADWATDYYGYEFFVYNDKLRFYVDGASGTDAVTNGAASIADGTWKHVVAVSNGTNLITYVNGSQDGQVAQTQTPDYANNYNLYLGAIWAFGGVYKPLSGSLDEVRISNSARSAGWIATEYANQNAPATFATFGAQSSNTLTVAGTLTNSAGTMYCGNPNVTVSGDFTVSGGAFTSTSGTLFVGGAFTHSGGTWDANNGSVVLNNTSSEALTLTAATTFKHLYINDGLVGYWKFDEASGTSCADSSGYGNTGTNNGATITSATTPVHFTDAYGLNFDGSDDYVNMGNVLNIGTGSFSISLWIKATSSSFQDIIAKSHPGPAIGRYTIGSYDGVGTKLDFFVEFSGTEIKTVTYSANTYDGTWKYVVGVVDRTGYMSLYVNGISVGTPVDISSHSGEDLTNTAPLNIAGYNNVGGYVNGIVDDVRIYNRALSAQEIQALAAGNQPATSIATTTVTDGDLDVNGNLVINAGTLDTGSRNITVAGNWENNGGKFTPNSQTVTMDGTSGSNIILSGGQKFNNLYISGSGGTWNLSDRLNVNSSPSTPSELKITAGTLDVRGSLGSSNVDYTIHASKWTQTGGTFTCRSGTVVLDSIVSATFTPSSTFNILRIEDPTESGLVGYWKFDEENGTLAFDSSGNGNNGTIINTLGRSYSPATTIVFDNPEAISFDGTGNYVSIPDSALWDFGTNNFSMAFWAKITAYDTQGTFFLEQQNGATYGGFEYYISNLGVVWFNANNMTNLINKPYSPTLDTWVHYAVTRSGNTFTLYANGNSLGTNDNSAALSDVSGIVAMGRWAGSSDYDLNGSLDDVRIYNRALSPTEVANLAAGRYADGATSTATQTLGANLSTGTLALDSGNINTSTYNVSISNDFALASGNGAFVGGSGSITCAANFALSGSSFTSTSGTLSIAGNWLQTGGTFTHNSGTVNFTKAAGSQDIILGSSPFYNLTHSGAGTLYVWPYRKAITIDHTKVSSDLTDFPVLVYINADANIGANAQSDGDDIIFTDSKGDRLSHEIEYYNVSGGNATSYIWVKVPSLSSVANTTLYISYGNTSCSSQQDATNVWDANYKGVWHLADPTNPTDSTINGNNGTNHSVTATTGQVDGAGNCDGVGYIAIPNSSDFDGTTGFTYSTIFRGNNNFDPAPAVNVIVAKGPYTEAQQFYIQPYQGKILLVLNYGHDALLRSGTTALAANTTYFLTLNYDGSTTWKLYLNNNLELTATSGVATNTDNVIFGAYVDGTGLLNGFLDETRISNSARSAGWIATEYANQNAPATFSSFSAQSSNTLTVAGTLTNSAGTFNAPTSTMSVAGNFANSGTFNHDNGTVTLNGALQAVSGNTTFYSLTKDVSAGSADTLTFAKDSTQTIAAGGTLTLKGGSGKVLTLNRTSGSGTDHWHVTVNSAASYACDYLSVSNSDATGGRGIIATNSTDGGNDRNWFFSSGNLLYWIAASSTNWNDVNNWATTSGGSTHPAAVPGASDDAIFDSAKNGDCGVDVPIDVKGLFFAGYTGTYSQGANAATIGADGFSQSSGTVNLGSNTITVNGNWTYSGGTITPQSSTVVFKSGSAKTITGSHTLNNVSFGTGGLSNTNAIIAGGTILTVAGTLTLAGELYGSVLDGPGSLYAEGNIVTSGSFSGTGNIFINGDGAQLFTGSSSLLTQNITIDKSGGGTLTLSGTTTFGGNWTYASGTLDAGSSTIVFKSGSAKTITGSHTLNNVSFGTGDGTGGAENTNTVIAGGTILTVTGTLTFNGEHYGAILDGTGSLYAKGNISIGNAHDWSASSIVLTINGAGDQILSDGGCASVIPIVIDKTSGTVTLASALPLNSAGQDLILTSGTLDLAGFSLTVNDQFTIGANGTLKMTGDEVSVTTPTSNTGTVEYSATSSTRDIKSWTYHNLEINGSGGTFTVSPANLTVSGNFILENGTFTAPTGTLSIGGNWIQTGGTFTHNSGTVDFNKTGSTQDLILGTSPFFNLTHSGTSTLYVWPYRKAITIDHTNVSADLTDFPVLIYINADANIGANAQSDGDDIIFTDSNGDRLSHEIEYYNVSGGNATSYIWVKIPSLSSTADTTLYISYGNSNCASQQDATNVWDSNYAAVWHMANNSSPATDSTINGNNASQSGGVTFGAAGKVGNAISLDGSDDYLQLASAPFNSGTVYPYSISTWFSYPGGGGSYRVIISQSYSSNSGGIYLLVAGDSLRSWNKSYATMPVGWDDGNFHNIVFKRVGDNPSNDLFYFDNTLLTTTVSVGNYTSATDAWRLGVNLQELNYWKGSLDEIRVSSSARSAGWIATEYANQNAPATFSSFSAQSSNTLTVAGTLTNSAGTMYCGNPNVTVSGDFTVSGGAFTSTSGTLFVGGAFTHSGGTWDANNGSVVLNNTSSKALTLTAPTTFKHLYINDGLVGYWKFDEAVGTDCADSSGYGNTGTNNGATITSATTPVHFTDGKVLSFDGTGDYVVSNSQIPVFTKISLAAWIKIVAYPSTNVSCPVMLTLTGQDSASYANGFQLDPSGNICMYGYDTGQKRATWGTPLSLDTWYHVVGTNDGSQLQIYVNGASGPTTGVSGSWMDGRYVVLSNVKLSDDNKYFSGLIDDARIYNRALSAQEIQALAVGNQPATSIATTTVTGGDLDVNGNLVINAGTLDTGTRNITVAGSWENNGGKFTPNSQTVTMDGTSGSNIILSGGQKFNNLYISGSGGTWNLSDRLNVNSSPSTPSELKITAGTLDVRGSLGATNVDYAIHASKWTQTGGTFTARSGTVVLDSIVSATFTPYSTFNILRIEDPSEEGLVGYWKFDEENGTIAYDASGTGNNGILTSTPGRSYSPASTIVFDDPEAMSFDGTNYVSIDDNASLDPSLNLTISLWVDASSISGSNYTYLVVKKGPSNASYGLWLSSSGKAYFESNDASVRGLLGATTLMTGTWYNIVATYDGSTQKIYVNGTLDNSTPLSIAGISYAANPVKIASGDFANVNFSGLIDDVRIYNRALSQTEVTNLATGHYASGATGTATQTLSANLTSATVAIDSGTLDVSASDKSINVSANWANYGGFTARSGTVTFDGATSSTSTITGTTTFNNLTCIIPSKSLAFEHGKTQTISGTLNINGQALGTKIVMNSDTTAQFSLTVASAQTIYYVSVSNSRVTGTAGHNITARNSTKVSNVTTTGDPRWIFGIDISGTISGITSAVPVSISVNGTTVDTQLSDASGNFSFAGVDVNNDDLIVIFVNDSLAHPSSMVGKILDAQTNVAGLAMALNQISICDAAGAIGTGYTNTNLNGAKNADTDTLYSVTGSGPYTVTFADNITLFIPTGVAYTPGGTVTAQNLHINGTLTAAANSITMHGNWDNVHGAFTSTGTVTFDSAATSTISGSSSFYDLACATAGKTITFTRGTEQTITHSITITGTSGNPITINDTGIGATPKLTLQAGKTQAISNVNVTNNDASGGLQLVAKGTSTLTGTTNWILESTGTVFTWTGTVSTAWNNPLNWDLGLVPSSTDAIIIPSGVANQPALGSATTINSLSIGSGDTLTTGGNSLTVTSYVTLNGAIAAGSSTITVGSGITGSGAITGDSPSISTGGVLGSMGSPITVNTTGMASIGAGGMSGQVSVSVTGGGNYSFSNSIPGFVMVGGGIMPYLGQTAIRQNLSAIDAQPTAYFNNMERLWATTGVALTPVGVPGFGMMPVPMMTPAGPVMAAAPVVPVMAAPSVIASPTPSVIASPEGAKQSKVEIASSAQVQLQPPRNDGLSLAMTRTPAVTVPTVTVPTIPETVVPTIIPPSFDGAIGSGSMPQPFVPPSFDGIIGSQSMPQPIVAPSFYNISGSQNLPQPIVPPLFTRVQGVSTLPAPITRSIYDGVIANVILPEVLSRESFVNAMGQLTLPAPVVPPSFNGTIGSQMMPQPLPPPPSFAEVGVEVGMQAFYPGGQIVSASFGARAPLGAESPALEPTMGKKENE